MLPITLAVLLLHLPSAARPAVVRADPPPTEAQRGYECSKALFNKQREVMRRTVGLKLTIAAIFTVLAIAAAAAKTNAGPETNTTPRPAAHTTVLPRTEGFWYAVPLARCWTPKAADLRHLEADLPQDLSSYYRQYLGITQKGRRLILVNGFSARVAPENTGGKHDWHRHMVFVTGGGKDYFNATYDPKIRKFGNLEYNSPLG